MFINLETQFLRKYFHEIIFVYEIYFVILHRIRFQIVTKIRKKSI